MRLSEFVGGCNNEDWIEKLHIVFSLNYHRRNIGLRNQNRNFIFLSGTGTVMKWNHKK
jgi:hypothetical protein